jgi:hypothetical protein
MKIIITTILTIFTCISVGAQDLFSNYQFTRIDQQPEYQLHTSLSDSSFYDDAIPGPDPSWDDGLKINMKTRTLISAGLFIPTIASGYTILMNVSFVATITTGSLQSIDGSMPGWVNSSHRITPWISMLASEKLSHD